MEKLATYSNQDQQDDESKQGNANEKWVKWCSRTLLFSMLIECGNCQVVYVDSCV